ncbi:MAG TPA: hypothetical protein VNL18_10315 [Gemmatimonadales bacterium]|nr:hypothetical protein [Gemmatimonadales bacterium]
MVEYEQQTLEVITGSDAAKTGRQRSALAHLANWARAYTEHKGATPLPFAEPEGRREARRLRFVAGALAAVVVALVMLLLYGR